MDLMMFIGALNMLVAGACLAMFSHKLAVERKFSWFDLFLVVGNLAFAFLAFSQ